MEGRKIYIVEELDSSRVRYLFTVKCVAESLKAQIDLLERTKVLVKCVCENDLSDELKNRIDKDYIYHKAK